MGTAEIAGGEIIDAEAVAQLTELIGTMEATDWRGVPGISAETAAVFTRQLIEARQDVRRGRHG